MLVCSGHHDEMAEYHHLYSFRVPPPSEGQLCVPRCNLRGFYDASVLGGKEYYKRSADSLESSVRFPLEEPLELQDRALFNSLLKVKPRPSTPASWVVTPNWASSLRNDGS